MTEKEKIKHYLDSKGVSKNKFYTQTGLSIGFLDSGKSLGADKIKTIINAFPDLSLEWLVMDIGDMIKQPLTDIPVINKFELRTDHEVEQQRIPLFEMEAAAGILSIENSTHKEFTPTGYISIPNLPSCDGGLFVRGDSMYPLIKSGDVVLYKQTFNLDWLIWGEIYLIAFMHEGDYFIAVKYITKSEEKDHIRLESYNKHHSPIDIPATSVRALAIIKASVRYHTMG